MTEPTAYQIRILGALQAKADHGQIYMGTVSAKTIARNRAANRVARRSRRINRLALRK